MEQWNGVVEFVAAVDQGGLSKAAKLLGVSPSHISKRINLLEERTGMRLLARSTRGISLTEIGEKYYQSVKPILNALESNDRYFSELQTEERGTLKISAPLGVGETVIMPAIAAFSKKYPKIQLVLDFSTRKINFVEERFDLALRLTPKPQGGLIARKLVDTRYYLMGSPEYFKNHGTPKDPKEIINHRALVFSQIDSTEPVAWTFTNPETQEEFNVETDVRIRSNSVQSLVASAVVGAGLIYNSGFFVEKELESGALIPVLEDWVPSKTGIWVVFLDRKQLPRKTRLFIDFLFDWFES